MANITIDGQTIEVADGTTILQAARMIGPEVAPPTMCYYSKLKTSGGYCRTCLVEVSKGSEKDPRPMPKLVASCRTAVMDGMEVKNITSEKVIEARKSVVEFLLINHPLDCPICDQGGECDLQDITLNYGSDRSRFFEIKRGVEDKQCGPIIKTIMTRCIHCTRCVRFLSELTGVDTLGSIGRGEHMEIGTYLNKYIKTELSGNLVDLCPVGAITSKPYAFLSRPWELKSTESIDLFDSIHSNIRIDTRGYEIVRILPRLN
jgi:NADH-quinone oxidoreductase subunit G